MAVIAMPKIIQLCDGIMASGQQATTHGKILSMFTKLPTNRNYFVWDFSLKELELRKLMCPIDVMYPIDVIAAVPALKPLVHDLYFLRGSSKSDSARELDTQREVVESMLQRLIHFHQVRHS